MNKICLLIMTACLSLSGGNNYTEKGEGWEIFTFFYKNTISMNLENVKKVTSGVLHEKFLNKRYFLRASNDFKEMKLTFSKEFLNENKTKLYVVLSGNDMKVYTVTLQDISGWKIVSLENVDTLHPNEQRELIRKYAKKGKGWQALKQFQKYLAEKDVEKSKELTTGDLKKAITKENVFEMAKHLKLMNYSFVKEYLVEDGTQLLVVINDSKQNKHTVTLESDGKWRIVNIKAGDAITPTEYNALPLQDKEKFARKDVMYKLKRISDCIIHYFKNNDSKSYPDKFEDFGIDERLLKYKHPRTGNINKILFVKAKDMEFTKSSKYISAMTGEEISGFYFAAFEDGHVSDISKSLVDQHKGFLWVPEKSVFSREEKNKALKLIDSLGAVNFKDRKEATKILIEMGKKVIPILKRKVNQGDLEINLSIQEIIKELEAKSFNGKRPFAN